MSRIKNYLMDLQEREASECEDCDGFGRVHNNGETDSPMFVQCETCGDERGQP